MPKLEKKKSFQRAYRFSGETIQKLQEIEKKRNFPSQILALETLIAEAHASLQVQKKPPAPTEDLQLQLTEALQEIDRLRDLLEKETQCFSRFEDEGITYCAKNAPRIVELPTLKICKACRFKITKETLTQQLPELQHYYTCICCRLLYRQMEAKVNRQKRREVKDAFRRKKFHNLGRC